MLPKNIDVSKIRYTEVKTLPNQSKAVYINYGSEKLTVQTPLMSLPYGMNDNEKFAKKDKDGNVVDDGPKRYDLNLSFRGMEDTPALKVFHDKMQELESKFQDDAFANRVTWLKDDFDGMKKMVSKLFSPIVKYDKDKETGKVVGKYPPTIKVKLPYDSKNDSFNFDASDMDGNELDFKDVMHNLKGARVRLIIELTGLWIAGGKYGCTWKVIRGRFQLPAKAKANFIEDSDDDTPATKKGAHLIDDEDLEEEAMAMAAAASPVKKPGKPAPASKKTAVVVSDDEDEEDDEVPPPAPTRTVVEDDEDEEEEEVVEEEEEEEEVPPPPPKPVKKTAAKSTKK